MPDKYSNDLPELINIYDKIVVKTDETNKYEIHESVLYLIDDFVNDNIELYMEKNFEDIIYLNILEMTYQCYENFNCNYNIEDIVSECIDIYFSTNIKRS